ncbi:tyrosine-protein phosphatase [Enterococcus sp. LJL99]
MIDLHCHILPGIDDGAQTMQDSLAMAQMAVDQGITHILCTPHHNNGRYTNPPEEVISQVATLQKALDEQGIALSLFEGQEVRISGDLLTQIQNNEILFADLSNRYILIEFPTAEIPLYAETVMFELLSQGKTPIIVHPERNNKFIEDPNRLIPFLQMGVLTQLTAPSYVGIFGKKIEKTAKLMVSHNMIHMMASDAHNVEKRGFFMKKAYAAIEKDQGAEVVSFMQQTARNIMNGEDTKTLEFEEIKKRKFGLF